MSVIQSQELFKRMLGNLTHDLRKRLVSSGSDHFLNTPVRNLGGGTSPMFGYRGVSEGLKAPPCLGKKITLNGFLLTDEQMNIDQRL